MPKTKINLSKRLVRELTRRMGGDIKVIAKPAENNLVDVYIQVSYVHKFVVDNNVEFNSSADGLAKGMMNFLVERIKQSAMAVGNMKQIREKDIIIHAWTEGVN